MIKISRNRFDKTLVDVDFPYCEKFVNSIKTLQFHKYDFINHIWTIKKADLKDLCFYLGIYNFSFEDDGLKSIATGYPSQEEKWIITQDPYGKITIQFSPNSPDQIRVSYNGRKYIDLLTSFSDYSFYEGYWQLHTRDIGIIALAAGIQNVWFQNETIKNLGIEQLTGLMTDPSLKMRVEKSIEDTVIISNIKIPYYDKVISSYGIEIIDNDTNTYRIPADHLYMVIADTDIRMYTFESNEVYRLAKGLTGEMQTAEEVMSRLENISPIVPYTFKTNPMPHQIEAFNYGLSRNCCLIGDEQGLGKTMEAINIAVCRKQRGEIRKCLIVCGVNSTKYNWVEEIHKHSDEQAVLFDQSASKKLKAIEEWGESDDLFGIINIEALRAPTQKATDEKEAKAKKRNLYKYLAGALRPSDMPQSEIETELNSIADMVIFDEIHKAKNANSKQGIALRQLNAKYKIGLSGTPMTNKMIDLWNILSWLGSIHISFMKFKQRYCVMGGYDNKEIVGYTNLEDIYYTLQKVMIRRRKDTVLNLPAKIHQNEYVELTPSTKKRYLEAKQGIIEKGFVQTESGFELAEKRTDIVLTQILKLRQITGGMNIDEITELSEKDNVKLLRIKEMLDEEIIPNGRKAIIFSSWENITAIYKEKLADYNPAYIVGSVSAKARQDEVNRFQNDPSCKIIIGTIGAMGTGLTLTAASYVFFVDKAWNQVDNEQAEDRAHRIGTSGNVTIITMIAKGTVDEKIEDVLKTKKNLFSAVIDGSINNDSEYAEADKKDTIYKLLDI